MTDRHRGYIVSLVKDIREDDAEAVISAIKMVKGVLSVKPIVSDISDHIAQERVRQELGEKIWHILYPTQIEKEE